MLHCKRCGKPSTIMEEVVEENGMLAYVCQGGCKEDLACVDCWVLERNRPRQCFEINCVCLINTFDEGNG